MDFDLPAEAEALRVSTREVVDDLLRHEPEFHRTGVVPPVVDETLFRMGYAGIAVPEEFGGTDLDLLTRTAVTIELSRMPVQFWSKIAATGAIVQQLALTTKAMREKWLPKLADGKAHIAFANTEPDCGSDVYQMKTNARREGDSYVINGTKAFISNAGFADIVLVFAYTDRSKGGSGISQILVERGTPGMSISAPLPNMGYSIGGLYEIHFDECRVPVENLLGEEGRGLFYAMHSINDGRILAAANAIGMGDVALEQALSYAQIRKTFGKPIASHQVVQHMLAEMKVNQHVARLTAYEGAIAVQRKQDERLKGAMAKAFCTEICSKTADMALQIHGGAGYMRGAVVERVYRDIRVLRILDGATEIQRNTIFKQMLPDLK
jgi:acyl-CoA dehydrogenase